MNTKFRTSLQFSTRCINQGAILKAAGWPVEVVRQPGSSRRSIFYADDTVETRALIDAYETKQVLPIPAKKIIDAKNQLFYEAGKAGRGEL